MPSKPSARRRWWMLLLVFPVLLFVYALVGILGVPKLMHEIAHEQIAKLGHKLELGEVWFNPFTFEVRIAGLRLSEADGSPLLGFDALYVNADVLNSIGERGVILQAVRWTAPDISLVVNADGSINPAKLVPPSPQPRQPEPPAPPPKVFIGELSIERGRIGIEDRSRPQPFSLALTPIEFSLKDFRTELNHENAYAFRGTASTGEEIEWTGDFSVQPIGSKGRFALRRLQTSTLVSYLQDQLPVNLVSGVAELGGDYRLSLDPALSLDVHLPAIIVRNLAVAEPGKSAPPVSIAELGLHELNLSLQQRDVVVQRVEIKGFRADVLRERDGSVNLMGLYAPPAAPAAPAPAPAHADPTQAAPWRVAVNRIQLANSEIAFEDRTVEPAVRMALTPVMAELTGFSSDLAAPLQLDTSLGIDRAGQLVAQGKIVLQPLSAQLALDLQGYELQVLQPYLAGLTGVALKSGQLAVKGKLSYVEQAQAEPKLDFAGEASVSKLDIEDRASAQNLLKWRELQVTGIDYRSAPQRLSIERVRLSEPYARVVISLDGEINVVRALAAPGDVKKPASAGPPRQPQATTPSKPMPILVKTIGVDKGRMQFTDQSIEPRFSAAIFGLNGAITNLASGTSRRAKIRLEGKVDEFAPVLISGEMHPSEFARDTDIALSFRNMDLISFNPYSGRFAGYNIVKGKLTTDLKYRIRDRALEAEHHVVLDQLEFGEATGSKDAVPLPVKLAVALLKDRHGRIDLGLPVRGNLDDPTFRIGPVVWKVLVNVMSKVVTAPFAALARLIGGGEELSYVDFAPGASDLSAAESGKLTQLARALIERPQLKLDVPLAQADAEDGKALARQELDRRVPGDATEVAPKKAQKNRLRALEDLHEVLLGTAPEYPAETKAVENDEEKPARIQYVETALLKKLAPQHQELENLAAARARTVQAALLADPGIAPERIFLTARRSAALSEAGAVRMELSLQ